MLVLGVETSTPQASVAIGSEQGVIASALVARGATYNEFLLPAVRFCLDQTGLGWRDLTGVAVSLGPGLYTGMRVGVSTAKAAAHARAGGDPRRDPAGRAPGAGAKIPGGRL